MKLWLFFLILIIVSPFGLAQDSELKLEQKPPPPFPDGPKPKPDPAKAVTEGLPPIPVPLPIPKPEPPSRAPLIKPPSPEAARRIEDLMSKYEFDHTTESCPSHRKYFESRLYGPLMQRRFELEEDALRNCSLTCDVNKTELLCLEETRKMVEPKEVPFSCVNEVFKEDVKKYRELGAEALKNGTTTPPYFRDCPSDNTSVKSIGRLPPHCGTPAYIDHVHWWLNQAMKCFVQRTDVIDSEEIFKVFAHEANFHVNVSSINGSGSSQLTTLGAQVTGLEERWNQARTKNPISCRPFDDVMEQELLMSGDFMKPCQFLTIENNPARSFAYGIIRMQVAYEEALSIMFQNPKLKDQDASNPNVYKPYVRLVDDRNELAKKLARLIYNKGRGKVEPALKVVALEYQKRKTPISASELIEKVQVTMRGLPDVEKDYYYSGKVDREFAALMKKDNQSCRFEN